MVYNCWIKFTVSTQLNLSFPSDLNLLILTYPQPLSMGLAARLDVGHEESGAVLPAAPQAEAQVGAVFAGQIRWRQSAVYRTHQPDGADAVVAAAAALRYRFGAHRRRCVFDLGLLVLGVAHGQAVFHRQHC